MIARKFKRAVTDSGTEVRYDPASKPGVSNLLEILAAATGQAPADLAKGYTQYGPLKADAGEAVIELLTPDPGALPRAARRPRRAGPPAAHGRTRPVTSPRRPSSGPTTPSGSCRPESPPRTAPAAVDHVDRRIVGLAIPALGSLAVEPLYVLVDTAIVGRLGTAQLGGLALAATVLSFVVAGCNFLTYGTTERVARRLGAGRHADAADVGVQAVWLSVLVGVAARPGRGAPRRAARRPAARRRGRRPRLRRHVPAHRCRSACRSSCSRSPPRACSAAPPTTARRS